MNAKKLLARDGGKSTNFKCGKAKMKRHMHALGTLSPNSI